MKTDWLITGSGGQAIVSDGGSMRCQLSLSKLMLWTTRNNLVNSEIIGLVRLSHASSYSVGGLVLRSDVTGSNQYYLRITTNGTIKTYTIYRIISGIATLIASASGNESPTVYTQIRFRIDGNQISLEEYQSGSGTWILIKSVIDTFITVGGYVGLRGDSGAAGYYINFDNITISERP